jgi:hypothetical protein
MLLARITERPRRAAVQATAERDHCNLLAMTATIDVGAGSHHVLLQEKIAPVRVGVKRVVVSGAQRARAGGENG